jgi:pimeloyl-ACP methyl ester carboxylesterase
MDNLTRININGVQLEYCWIGPPPGPLPTIIFLHEGLGSVSQWKGFPQRLVERTGLSALVYSRAGYGKSDPVRLPRPISYMHDEADILEKIISHMNIRKAILVGHSDGASISLIYAGKSRCSNISMLLLEAPHVFTEPSGLASIAKITDVYRTSDLRDRLAKHHGPNTDGAFWGWNNVWLDPDFRSWNIETFLPAITAPLLRVQGNDDEYGTVRQIEAIERQVSGPVEVLNVPACGHAPHREHPKLTLDTMTEFIQRRLANE